MSDDSIKKSSHAYKGSSGEHPILQGVRAKIASIREGQLPELEALNRRIDKVRLKSDPPLDEKEEEEEPIPDTEPATQPTKPTHH